MHGLLVRKHETRPTRRRVAGSIVCGALVALLTAGLPAPSAQADEVTTTADGLVLRYKLDESAGSVATDSSGNGRNGTVNGTASWAGGSGLTFDGSSTYIKVPDNIMSGLSSISVSFDVYIAVDQATPYFLYGFGNTDPATAQGKGYLFATANNFRTAIATGNWSTEQSTRASASDVLDRGTWKHVTYTQTGTTATLYEDGVPIATNTAITIKPADVGGGTTTANYVGRSVYTGDRLFKGRMKDFRVYSRALAAAEVAALATPMVTDELRADTAALTLGDTSGLTADLALPAAAPLGSRVTWASSDPDVMTATGAVTRPSPGQPDASATLTATLIRGAQTATRSFPVTVRAQLTPGQVVEEAAGALTVRDLDDVRGNLTLPTAGAYGTAVAWSSNRPEAVDATGLVHRPAHGKGAAEVTLTATVTSGSASATRRFTATVAALPAAEPRTGYLFSYFTGEGSATGEQVYYAVSKANDPLAYREVNNAKPVLTSTLGTKGLRDPFIIRSPEGDKFYQIATDLKINGNGNWDASQRTGSKSIMVWESTDLVNWTDQRLVRVAPDTAGNTWAPEAYFDPTIGAYVVFWASKLYDVADPAHTGNTYNRMMYATTRDFHTFSDPQVWVDPGYSVIDSTVIDHNGVYHRLTKEERNNTSSSPCGKFLTQEKSTSLRSAGYTFIRDCIGKGEIGAGEGPLVFKSNTEQRWYLFIDEFSGQGYTPFTTTDLDSGRWEKVASSSLPRSPRHGTVLPITQDEYDRLLTAYQPNLLVTSVDHVSVTTRAGTAPTLPQQVTARHADGSSATVAVVWDQIPANKYARPGSFAVAGTIAESQNVKAVASVAVPDEGAPQVNATVTPRAPDSGWYTGPVQVAVTATDEVDGVVMPKVRVTRQGEPAGSWNNEAQPLTLDADGVYLVEYTATDAAGNAAGVAEVTVRIDRTAPVSQATVDDRTRTVTLRAADNHSGIARVEYSVDGGRTWQVYGTPLNPARSVTSVLYRAVDAAGNVEVVNRVTLPAASIPLVASTVRATLSAAKVPYGTAPVVKVSVTGKAATQPTGTVRVLLGGERVGTGKLSGGRATISLSKTIDVGLGKLQILYGGDARYAGSATVATVWIVPATSKTTVQTRSATVRAGAKAEVTIRVTGPVGVKPAGSVWVTAVNGRSRVTMVVRLTSGGQATARLGPLRAPGTYRVKAMYLGSPNVTGSTSKTIEIRVVR